MNGERRDGSFRRLDDLGEQCEAFEPVLEVGWDLSLGSGCPGDFLFGWERASFPPEATFSPVGEERGRFEGCGRLAPGGLAIRMLFEVALNFLFAFGCCDFVRSLRRRDLSQQAVGDKDAPLEKRGLNRTLLIVGGRIKEVVETLESFGSF